MEAKFSDVPDDLWRRVEPLLPVENPKPRGGRPRVPVRRVFAGIVYRLKTGCQWKALPREFGSGATCHRYFTAWVKAGVFERMWKVMLKFYDRRKRIGWMWSSLDAVIIKAPKG